MLRQSDIPKKPEYNWIPISYWKLYHATTSRNVKKILMEGLSPLSVGEGELIKEPLLWVSTSPEAAVHHAKSRHPGEPVALLSFTVDSEEVGIHRYIGSSEVFTIHETIPPDLISVEYEEGLTEDTFE